VSGPLLGDNGAVRRSAFLGLVGAEVEERRAGYARIALQLQEHHMNPGGVMHGGVVTALLDEALATAVAAARGPEANRAQPHTSIEMNASFLRAARAGDAVVVEGRLLRQGRSVIFGEAEARKRGDDRLVSKARFTFLVPPPRTRAGAAVAAPVAAPGQPPSAKTGHDPVWVSPFSAFIGARADEVGEGYVRLALTLAEEHTNPSGVMHGGVVMTLMDSAMGLTLRLQRGEDVAAAAPHATIEMNVSFLAAARVGDEVLVEGRLLRLGRTIAFGEAEARKRDDDRLIAKGRLTFAIPRTGE